jgi:subtilisin family serine protease
MSLSSSGDSAVLDAVIKQALADGIIIFAAAGNEPVDSANYPAAIPGVNAVTATQNGKLAPYADFGSFVSLALPGANVVYYGNQAYVFQGTSVATALATGVAAGTKGQNCWPWSQIQTAMQQKFPVPAK